MFLVDNSEMWTEPNSPKALATLLWTQWATGAGPPQHLRLHPGPHRCVLVRWPLHAAYRRLQRMAPAAERLSVRTATGLRLTARPAWRARDYVRRRRGLEQVVRDLLPLPLQSRNGSFGSAATSLCLSSARAIEIVTLAPRVLRASLRLRAGLGATGCRWRQWLRLEPLRIRLRLEALSSPNAYTQTNAIELLKSSRSEWAKRAQATYVTRESRISRSVGRCQTWRLRWRAERQRIFKWRFETAPLIIRRSF